MTVWFNITDDLRINVQSIAWLQIQNDGSWKIGLASPLPDGKQIVHVTDPIMVVRLAQAMGFKIPCS